MRRIGTSAFEVAQRYAGYLTELDGAADHPFIQHCFGLCGMGLDTPDSVPWCSAFAQHPAWELRLPRSKSARARSWLAVGVPMSVEMAEPGFDVVVLKRGSGEQPGPEVIEAPGHVGYFAGKEGSNILVLGGNQSNSVSVIPFPETSLLGIRRLA